MKATYSPDDNKLRLYSDGRLPRDLYDRVRAAGFVWAPKQELFVAPAWTPDRADRAAGAVRAAKYKERPDVRARRIRGLEADERKRKRERANAAAGLRLWTETPLTHEQAVRIAGRTEAGYLLLPPKEGDRAD